MDGQVARQAHGQAAVGMEVVRGRMHRREAGDDSLVATDSSGRCGGLVAFPTGMSGGRLRIMQRMHSLAACRKLALEGTRACLTAPLVILLRLMGEDSTRGLTNKPAGKSRFGTFGRVQSLEVYRVGHEMYMMRAHSCRGIRVYVHVHRYWYL